MQRAEAICADLNQSGAARAWASSKAMHADRLRNHVGFTETHAYLLTGARGEHMLETLLRFAGLSLYD